MPMLPPRVHQLLNYHLFKQRGKDVTESEWQIFEGIWQNHDYNTIAKATGYQPVTVRRNASHLLQELSTATQQKITKHNFQVIFNQLTIERQSTVDWEDAPTDIQPFCGRLRELEKLAIWVAIDNCKLIAILGIGGIGKTALATKLGQQLQDRFEFVIWRSLREAPPLNQLLGDLIGVLSQHTNTELPKTSPKRIGMLLEYLQQHRCLLILDNVESIMDPGQYAGNYREGYSNYGDLFHRLGSSQHQSCVKITSREPPPELAELSGDRLPVRTLALAGIETDSVSLLQQMGVTGQLSQLQTITDRCQGNPLYLRIIANTIINTFEGDLDDFLDSDRYTYAKIGNILTTQLARLTIAEKLLIYCLAIRREPISIDALTEHFAPLDLDRSLPSTIDSLIKRSIVQSIGNNYPTANQVREKSGKVKRYTLQNVILEFTTDRLIEELNLELESPDKLFFFNHLALHPTSAPEYIRDIQQRLLLQPISRTLTNRHNSDTVAYLQSLIPIVRTLTPLGYAAGNLLDLAIELQADFTGWDLTDLHICEVDFQEVPLPQVNFSGTVFDRCKFAQGMGIIFDLTFSPDGQLLAASGTDCQIHLYSVATGRTHAVLSGHTGWVGTICFSSDSRYLISGSKDRTLRLWDTHTGECLQIFHGHQDYIWIAYFLPSNSLIVSIDMSGFIKFWWLQRSQPMFSMRNVSKSMVWQVNVDAARARMVTSGSDGVRIQSLWLGQTREINVPEGKQIHRVVFSPDGKYLWGASFDFDVYCWDLQTDEIVHTLVGHRSRPYNIAFTPDGQRVVTTSLDSVRVWSIRTGICLRAMYPDYRSYCSSLHRDGEILAIASDNGIVELWNIDRSECLSTFSGHPLRFLATSFVETLPHRIILAGRDDGKILSWQSKELDSQPLPYLEYIGHTSLVRSIDISRDNRRFVSCSHDLTVRLWDIQSGDCLATMTEHTNWVHQALFLDEQTVVSVAEDGKVCCWNIDTGIVTLLPTNKKVWLMGIAVADDRRTIAVGYSTNTIEIWDWQTRTCRTLDSHGNRIKMMSFSSDEQHLVTLSDDGIMSVCDYHQFTCESSWSIDSHDWMVLKFIPNDKHRIAIAGRKGIEIWDIAIGEPVQWLRGHTAPIGSISFTSCGKYLISSGEDGTVKLWDIVQGKLIHNIINTDPFVRVADRK
jgi:WD40 repeat protein